jgi:hypothetical protein
MVLSSRRNLQKCLARSISAVIAVVIPEQLQTLISGTQQTAAVEEHSLGPGSGTVGKGQSSFCGTIAVTVNQNTDVTRPRYHHTAAGIDRQRMNVMG